MMVFPSQCHGLETAAIPAKLENTPSRPAGEPKFAELRFGVFSSFAGMEGHLYEVGVDALASALVVACAHLAK